MSTLRRPLSPRSMAVLAACAAVGIAIAGCATSRSAPASSHTQAASSESSAPTSATNPSTTSGSAATASDRPSGTPAGPAAESDEAKAAGIRPFPEAPVFDYQLGQAYAPDPAVTLVVRDSSAEPAAGLYNVCYVNGFQTQPADVDFWLSNNRDLVLWDDAGKPVTDPDWPGEFILDISTSAKRARIVEIQSRALRDCANKGFQAVELDNLDSYTRSEGAFDLGDNSAMAALFTAKAHALGLPIGQKNTPELGWAGSDEIGFDFAVAEECLAYDECSAYTDVYGKRVISIEYTDNTLDFSAECQSPGRPATTILRDRQLSAPGTPGYSFERCSP